MEQQAITRQRIDYYDIAKGIGILMVVWAHAEGPGSNYINQFHMPLFFLISGLLFSDKGSIIDYTKRKIYSLYIPFVFWNLLFYVGYSLLTSVGLKEIIVHAGAIVLAVSKDGVFLGATWFIGGLFLMSILYKLVTTIIPESNAKKYIVLLIFTAIGCGAFIITFPLHFSRVLVLSFFFAIAAFCKQSGIADWLMKNERRILAAICFVAFLVITPNAVVAMASNTYENHILFIIKALMASYSVIYFSKDISTIQNTVVQSVKKGLIFLGKHSMDIVIWQFVFFRLVIILQLALNGIPVTVANVMEYYPYYSVENGWWIVYTIVGCAVPLLWGILLRSGSWGKLFKKLHIV